jgi:PPOX class probable FMN-dependent enzyme
MADDAITDRDALRSLYPEPASDGIVAKKVLARLDRHCRAFIALSPFLVIATAGRDGATDASPRGDGPGFVVALDDRTLLLPDRRGNNRCDSLANALENPKVGLLFFVPGVIETLRVNGVARLTTDPALLEPAAVGGSVPRSGMLIAVEEAFFHCGKALLRSKLWEPESRVAPGAFPTLGRVLADQIRGVDAEGADLDLVEAYRKRLY